MFDESFAARQGGPGVVDLIGTHQASFGKQICKIIFVGKHSVRNPDWGFCDDLGKHSPRVACRSFVKTTPLVNQTGKNKSTYFFQRPKFPTM